MINKLVKKIIRSTIFIIFALVIYVTLAYLGRNIQFKEASTINSDKWLLEYKDTPIKDSYNLAIIKRQNEDNNDYSEKILIAARKLGWKPKIITYQKGFIESIKSMKADFIISSIQDMKLDQELPVNFYLLMNESAHNYFEGYFSFTPLFKEKLYSSIKYADGFLCSFQELDLIKKFVEEKKGKFHGVMFFPYSQFFPYQEVIPKSLVYIDDNFDLLRSSNRYKIIFKKLSENIKLSIYGNHESFKYIEESWSGDLEDDVVNINNIYQKYGIALVLSSKEMLKDETPNPKLMAASSASAIIITDKNPFTVKEFGDSVLYIDENKSANGIYQDIEYQLNYALKNQKEVLSKAKKAHDIFVNKFTLEKELVNLAKMHEKILLDKKKN